MLQMQMIVVLTKMMDCITLMELIAYSVSVSGLLNSVPCIAVYDMCKTNIILFHDIIHSFWMDPKHS